MTVPFVCMGRACLAYLASPAGCCCWLRPALPLRYTETRGSTEPRPPARCRRFRLPSPRFQTVQETKLGCQRPKADGSFAGCLQVDAVTTGPDLVRARVEVSKFVPSPAPDTREALALSPLEGPPGTLVTLTGPAPAVPSGGHLNDRVQVCWDACTALSYSEPVRWSAGSPGRFEFSFQVPTVPWLTDKGVHPLVPGSYRVILPCFWVETAEKPKGECQSGQRTGSFRLTGPGSSLCLSGQPCSAVEVSPTEGPPGTAIAVRGWAPLVGLAAWGSVHIQLRSAVAATNALPTLASAPFQVKGGLDWASLRTLHPASILRSDIETIGVDPANPGRFAYCSEGTIQLTTDGGQAWSSVSIEGALTASAATKYPLVPSYTVSWRPWPSTRSIRPRSMPRS